MALRWEGISRRMAIQIPWRRSQTWIGIRVGSQCLCLLWRVFLIQKSRSWNSENKIINIYWWVVSRQENWKWLPYKQEWGNLSSKAVFWWRSQRNSSWSQPRKWPIYVINNNNDSLILHKISKFGPTHFHPFLHFSNPGSWYILALKSMKYLVRTWKRAQIFENNIVKNLIDLRMKKSPQCWYSCERLLKCQK